jgi:hypothetical protein
MKGERCMNFTYTLFVSISYVASRTFAGACMEGADGHPCHGIPWPIVSIATHHV